MYTGFTRGTPTKFGRVKTSKIQRDFWQFLTLIANISGTDRHIENRKSTWSTTFYPLLGVKKFGELWSTNKKGIGSHVDPPMYTFSAYYNSAVRGCCPLKFLHTLQPPKMYFKSDLGHRAASSWAMPHISSFVQLLFLFCIKFYKLGIILQSVYGIHSHLIWTSPPCIDINSPLRLLILMIFSRYKYYAHNSGPD